MTLGALIDNDVLQKFATYGMTGDLAATISGRGTTGVLGAARFVVRRALKRLQGPDGEELKNAFELFIQDVAHVEPTQEEVELATQFEEMANRHSLGFDSGESQLCAIAIVRGVSAVITGDKRAIESAERIAEKLSTLHQLAGKLVCLEQLMLGVVNAVGFDYARSQVCAQRAADTALSICFKCWAESPPEASDTRSAFESYIRDLRSRAPSLLRQGLQFP